MSEMIFKPAPKSVVENAFSKALFAAREQILTDCNYFVKVDQGTLRDTAETRTEEMDLFVIYTQRYAKRQYYTGTPSKDQNPNASLQWCEKAKQHFGKDWIKILEKGMRDAL